MEIRLFHEKSNPALPWTLRIMEPGGWAHYGASKVHFHIPTTTDGDPDSQAAQKWFILANGSVRWDGTEAHIEEARC